MAYLNCPKCGMKFHEKSIECPKCKTTPDAYREKQAKSEAAYQKYQTEKQEKETAKAAVIERNKKTYCRSCGSTFEKAKLITRGTFMVELALWLLFLLPGLIYSVWRLTTKYKACPICQASDIIPVNSPVAMQALGK